MRKHFYTLAQYILLAAIVAFSFQACEATDPEPIGEVKRGEILKTHSLGIMSANEIQQKFAATNTQLPFTLNYSVEIISIEYYTDNKNGNKVLVSGALLVPQGVDNLPLINLMHGTQSKRDLVASVSPINSVEGTIGLLTASLGYLTVIPDYIGFGVSNEMHPYFHAESLIPSIIDIMRAGKTYCSGNQISLDGRVFLTGYSEGGYASLLAQNTIEEEYSAEFNLTAVAPLSGPYDLKGTVDTAFQTSNYEGDIAYIGYFFTAYNEIYGWNRINDFFNAPYASMMQGLYDGSKTWGEILAQLPSSFAGLMNPNFVANYLNESETDVITAFQENTILNWTPQTPIHFFHGDADVTVPYQNVIIAIDKFQSNGAANIQLTTIAGGTHATSGPAASIGAIQWFESFE